MDGEPTGEHQDIAKPQPGVPDAKHESPRADMSSYVGKEDPDAKPSISSFQEYESKLQGVKTNDLLPTGNVQEQRPLTAAEKAVISGDKRETVISRAPAQFEKKRENMSATNAATEQIRANIKAKQEAEANKAPEPVAQPTPKVTPAPQPSLLARIKNFFSGPKGPTQEPAT